MALRRYREILRTKFNLSSLKNDIDARNQSLLLSDDEEAEMENEYQYDLNLNHPVGKGLKQNDDKLSLIKLSSEEK